MNKVHNIATIITNAFNKDYTAKEAVDDLEMLMNEATIIELSDGPTSSRFREMIKLINIQEKVVKAKVDSDQVFAQLDTITARQHTDN